MNLIKKWWTFGVHAAAMVVLLINPADITTIATNHPKQSLIILWIWGHVLAWAKSPNFQPTTPPPTSNNH